MPRLLLYLMNPECQGERKVVHVTNHTDSTMFRVLSSSKPRLSLSYEYDQVLQTETSHHIIGMIQYAIVRPCIVSTSVIVLCPSLTWSQISVKSVQPTLYNVYIHVTGEVMGDILHDRMYSTNACTLMLLQEGYELSYYLLFCHKCRKSIPS